eukprot:5246267-Amphidinium_carterae.1
MSETSVSNPKENALKGTPSQPIQQSITSNMVFTRANAFELSLELFQNELMSQVTTVRPKSHGHMTIKDHEADNDHYN